MSEPREWRVVQLSDNPEHLEWEAGEFVEKSAYDALITAARERIAELTEQVKVLGQVASKHAGENLSVFDRLRARIAELESVLMGLLNDTQHADHNCGDPMCPVDEARAALEAKGRES